MEVEALSRLNARMLAASIEPKLWVEFLDELSRTSGGVKTHLFGFDVECDVRHPLISSGYDDGFVKSYLDHYHAINEWAFGCVRGKAGQVIASEEMCSSEKLTKTEFYNDWVRPQEDVRFGGGTILFKERSRFYALGGNVRSKDGRDKEVSFLRTVELLAPSLRLAFNISRSILTNRLSETIDSSTDLRETGSIVVLNTKGQVLYISPSADNLFGGNGMLRFKTDSRLGLNNGAAEHQLYQALACFRSKPTFFGTEFDVDSADGKKFVVRLAAFRPNCNECDDLRLLLNIDEPCLVLVISDMDTHSSLRLPLMAVHGFTAAEAEVSELLSEFHSPREIAQMRNSSVHTVRNQIKSGMAKLAVRQRSKYILMLCRIRDQQL